MAGQKERGETSRFPQARKRGESRKKRSRDLGEAEQTQNCRGDLPKCRQKRKVAHPWKGSWKVSWAAKPMSFTKGNRATKLKEDLEVLH